MTIMTPYFSRAWNNKSLASNLWQELDELYNRGFDNASVNGTSERTMTPSTEVQETEKHFLLSMDMPGLKREDLKIEVQSNVLMIAGERAREPRRTFKRSFTLPESVNVSAIEARYEDGVLELYLPKAEAAQPRKIEIQTDQTAKGGFFDKLLGSKKSEPELKTVNHQQ